ncbi:MAG: hypothetical protein LBE20_06540 [Deltaproteobacteria bacterium]|jgi:hypothetical protein|nr:hypothetical protein [Deltaproteobacteria bacterium]
MVLMVVVGQTVIIDSDPYLKQLVWETLNLSEVDAYNYISNFDNRLIAKVGFVAPYTVIGINLSKSFLGDLLERIQFY